MFNHESGTREVLYTEMQRRCGDVHMTQTYVYPPSVGTAFVVRVCAFCGELKDSQVLRAMQPNQSQVKLELQEVSVKHTT